MVDNKYDGYGDVTPEEYAQMEADMEEIYGDDQPSEEELDGMFVEHVLDKVKQGEFHSTLNDWVQVHDQIASLGRIRHGEPSATVLNGAEADFKQTMDLLGYNEKSRMSPAEWVDQQGIAAGRREGRNWRAVIDGDYSIDPNLVAIDDIKAIPFDEMVAYRTARNEPWTKADTNLLNLKICQEWDSLNEDIYVQQMENDKDLLSMDDIELLREKDGIQGDEPTIPWYEANRRAFGKDRETVKKEHDENAERIEQMYGVLRDELFKRVYATGMTRMDALPEVTRGNYKANDSLISRQTYNYLGSEYGDYYRKQIREYADETVRSIQARSVFGVDFSLHGTGSQIAVEPQNARTKMFADSKKASVNKNRDVPHDWKQMLNSVENGVSNSGYDFDEYDN